MTDFVTVVFSNIAKRKKRTALTLIGLFIGVAAVVALVSLGQGLQQTINAQFEKVGADKIIIQAKEIGYSNTASPGKLTIQDRDTIAKVHGVSQAAGQLFPSSTAVFNDMQRTVMALSLPPSHEEAVLTIAVHTIEAEKGRLLTYRDRQKAVVGYDIANSKVFGKNVQEGNTVLLEGEPFTVVGSMARMGDPVMDRSFLISEEDARRIFNETEGYAMITAQANKGEDPDAVAAQIEKTLRRKRHQKEGKEDFTVQTATELIASFMSVLNIVQAVFVGIAFISLIVGGVGIMNTMFTAVLERTREIGIMKAIGAQNSDIYGLFLLESAVIGGTGGLLGIASGAGLSMVIKLAANSIVGPGTINLAFPPWLLIGMFIFSMVVGTISGILPARRAAKLQPVDALREE